MKRNTLLVAGALIVALAVGYFLLYGHRAHAQQPDVNCSALWGSKYMCLKNASNWPIVAVQATSAASFGPNWISIPGGPISPGGTSIVAFPTWAGGCVQYVSVKTADNKTHSFGNVNVCNSTSFVIRGW